jgi:MFS family permease
VFPSAQLLLLILISLTAHAALAGARITTSLYALSLQATEFTIGTLIALFALFPMLLAVKVGRMIDRVGILRPMLGGALAIAAGCTLAGLVGGLAMLYCACVLIGTGFMVIQVAVQHTVGAISSNEARAANFSWMALGFSVSGFCGPVIAGFVIDHAHFAASYLTFAVFALCALGLASAGSIRLPRLAGAHRTGAAHSALQLLRDKDMAGIYFIGTLLASAWDLFTFVLPIHGTRSGFSASTIGLILGCFSIATFLVRLVMPWLSRRYTEWQILTAALALAAISYALIPLMRQSLTLALAAAALGLAVGAAQPNMLALLHQSAPAGRAAEAVGVRIMIGNGCQVFLPLAFGGAGAVLGLGAIFWGMGAMIGAGVPIALRRARRSLAPP